MDKRLGKIWLCTVLLAGCMIAPPLPREWAARLFVADTLKPDVQIAALYEVVLADGSLQVRMSGRSLSFFAQRVRYRAVWFDRAGMPIDSTVSAWNHAMLERNRPFDFTVVGPGRRATSYRIELERDH